MSEENLTPWQKFKAAQGEVRPWHLLDPRQPKATESQAKTRMDVCLSCDRLTKSTKQCKECGCFMHLKTLLAEATCPLKKWES